MPIAHIGINAYIGKMPIIDINDIYAYILNAQISIYAIYGH